ncbi:NAD-dependent_histone deacetylase Sir2 [Hexamita inflata]|uniref:NAD-dependent_histone deacetylase Sir2 n=1 Tax=Hexamita inflata TaxID=28002 RepID=A0ABP1GFX6_9EUKA
MKRAAELIKSADKIMVVAGAGISVACGIPDFRSPGTGLYSQLSRFNLPYPTAMFDIQYIQQRPRPFFALTNSIFPDASFKPSFTHCFLRLLQDKNKLFYTVTQNIDDIEKHVGISNLSQAHGSFTNKIHCVRCQFKSTQSELLKSACKNGAVAHCPLCGAVVKPGIVFFGENLPEESQLYEQKVKQTDLMLVLGTSLQVAPVSSLPVYAKMFKKNRILVNREAVGDFKLEKKNESQEDVLALGDCDEVIQGICKELGWEKELNELYQKFKSEKYEVQKAEKSGMQVVALMDSLVIPTAQIVKDKMFAVVSEKQLKVLQEQASEVNINIDIAEVPVQFKEYATKGIKTFTKQIEKNGQIVYSPIGAHYAYYVSKFIEIAKENEQDDVWDKIDTGFTHYRNQKKSKEENVEDKINYVVKEVEELVFVDEKQAETIVVQFQLKFEEEDAEKVDNKVKSVTFANNISETCKQSPLKIELVNNVLKVYFGKEMRGDGFEILKGIMKSQFDKVGATVSKVK